MGNTTRSPTAITTHNNLIPLGMSPRHESYPRLRIPDTQRATVCECAKTVGYINPSTTNYPHLCHLPNPPSPWQVPYTPKYTQPDPNLPISPRQYHPTHFIASNRTMIEYFINASSGDRWTVRLQQTLVPNPNHNRHYCTCPIHVLEQERVLSKNKKNEIYI